MGDAETSGVCAATGLVQDQGIHTILRNCAVMWPSTWPAERETRYILVIAQDIESWADGLRHSWPAPRRAVKRARAGGWQARTATTTLMGRIPYPPYPGPDNFIEKFSKGMRPAAGSWERRPTTRAAFAFMRYAFTPTVRRTWRCRWRVEFVEIPNKITRSPPLHPVHPVSGRRRR